MDYDYHNIKGVNNYRENKNPLFRCCISLSTRQCGGAGNLSCGRL